MYERAFRLPAGRSAFAGVVVAALALNSSFIAHPAMGQNYGRPNVIVDDSVLDQLGPPPQSLPDVLLLQQPQSTRPASDAAMPQAQGRLLPPPPVMPKSRVMLPSALQQMLPESSPASRPQTARAPRAAPVPKVERSLPATPPAMATAPSEPSVVPPSITPPAVSVPEAPAVTPPPAPPTLPTPEIAGQTPAAPPVAKAEMPKAPPPAAPSLPTLEPPAPPEAATSEPSTSEKAAMPETAAVPPPPAVEPPAPPSAATPPAPTPNVAAKAPSPRMVRPVPQVAETPPAPKAESDGASGSEPASAGQLASLPPSGPPEILEDGQMYRIPFGSVSSEISEDGKKYLDKLAQRLKKDDALRLQLLGYAGSTQDSASKARRTSLFRALSVRTYLMKQGVRSTRMDVRALGNLAEGGAPDRVDAVIRK
jgi:outer membrane protein OmpA-like peptidoglycan-associated protein